MTQRAAFAGLLVFVLAVFGGLVVYDVKHGHKLEKFIGKDQTTQNWKWEDKWDDNDTTSVPQQPRTQPEVQPVPPVQQLTVGSYQEAIQKSGELGRPVLVVFTADWCAWCKKLKSETMTNSQVQAALKNYILVYVDTDKEKTPTRQFGIQQLPTCVITNAKQDKLKFDAGFKNADSMVAWLNNPSLMQQPKVQPQPTQPPQSQPNNRKRR